MVIICFSAKFFDEQNSKVKFELIFFTKFNNQTTISFYYVDKMNIKRSLNKNIVFLQTQQNYIYVIFNILIIILLQLIKKIRMPSNQQKTKEDIQFQEKLKKAMYKTTYHDIGKNKTNIPPEKSNGISGKFTDHLIYSGMYKNASLNTTAQKDRWVNGSKDWMQHLG